MASSPASSVPDGGNLASDFVWALFNSDATAQASFAKLDGDMQELMRGYAAGYNRYLRDTGVSALPAPCRDAAWVRSITEFDMMKVLNKLNLRAGVANFIDPLVGAQPPVPATAAIDTKKAAPVTPVGSAAEAQRLLAQTDLPTWDVHAFGSNAVALGRDLTNDGQGALLGNPHFPWFGISRFHAVHLTIPGRYDAMGAAIYGFPLVSIGFNRFVAWSHTVSTARRFVVRELTLAPGDPTSYVYDGDVVPMTTETVTVDVLQPDGSLVPVSHTFYLTQFGPMLILPPLANWTDTNGYAFTDVNVGNVRGLQQYREMGSARSIGEFEQAIESHVALPWVNTIAADRDGNAYYGDISTVPHVTDAKLFACANTFVAQVLSFGAGLHAGRLDIGVRPGLRSGRAAGGHLRRRATSRASAATTTRRTRTTATGSRTRPSPSRASRRSSARTRADPRTCARGSGSTRSRTASTAPTACRAPASIGSGSRTSSTRTATTAPSSCSMACSHSVSRRTTTWTSAGTSSTCRRRARSSGPGTVQTTRTAWGRTSGASSTTG